MHGFQMIDTVFAEIHDPSGSQRRKHIRRLFLGDGDESDPLRITPVRTARRRDQGTCLGEVGSDPIGKRGHETDVPRGDARSRAAPWTIDVSYCAASSASLIKPFSFAQAIQAVMPF